MIPSDHLNIESQGIHWKVYVLEMHGRDGDEKLQTFLRDKAKSPAGIKNHNEQNKLNKYYDSERDWIIFNVNRGLFLHFEV